MNCIQEIKKFVNLSIARSFIMKKTHVFFLTFVLMILVINIFLVSSWQIYDTAQARENLKSEENHVNQDKSIQWFKEQMKISDKYVQKESGIWGMSWAHFTTMVLLILFAIVALFVFIQQQKRTKEIVEMIKKEMKHGN